MVRPSNLPKSQPGQRWAERMEREVGLWFQEARRAEVAQGMRGVRRLAKRAEGASATYSTLFIEAMAASAAASSAKRTKPKPRLRPVSRSLTTICEQEVSGEQGGGRRPTYRLIDGAEFLEFGPQRLVVGVPCQAAAAAVSVERREGQLGQTHW